MSGERLRRIYRLALRAWPREVREAWGAGMEETFARMIALEGAGRGVWGRALLITSGFADAIAQGLRARVRSLTGRAGLFSTGASYRGRRIDWMGTTWMDLRYALRTLVHQPLFSLAAIVTLGLGIGANTSIFSVAWGLLFRSLAYEDPDRLVLIWSTNPSQGWTRTDVSPADAWDWRSRASSLADLGVVGRGSVNLTGVDRPERLNTKVITTNVFDLFGVAPAYGRNFTESDGRPGAPGTAILSWGFWQRRFGGDRGVIGSTIELDGEAVALIGVLPETFAYPDDRPDLYQPLREDPSGMSRTSHAYNAIARLAPDATVEQASRDVARVAEELEAAFPDTNAGWSARVVRLRDDVVGDVGRQAVIVLMAAVGFVLLMACVNVANLLLARGSARRRELAVRAALGAGRGRVTRLLLTESLVLALAGGALGVGLAVAGTRTIAAAMPANLPPVFQFTVDRPVLLFALVLSLTATLMFGLLPALRGAASADAELRGRGVAGGRKAMRMGSTLVVVQTALAVVLLVGGGIMMRSVEAMQRRDLGYSPDGVLTLRVTPPSTSYTDGEALDRFYEDVLERIRTLPGIASAGSIQNLPLHGSNNSNSFTVESEPATNDGHPARMGYLSPGYLETMRIGIVRGRGIMETDRADAPRIALINETLARQRFGDADPIGRALRFDEEVWTVVGVVRDMIERELTRAPEPSIYVAVAQAPTRSRSIVLRAAGDPLALAEAAQRAISAVDADQPAYEVQPMTALVEMRLSPFRLIAGLMLVFAAIALLLGGVGIYGVTAYAVGRRTSEIGIRLAVGANRPDVIRMIVREGLTRGLLGVAIGLPLALMLARLMAGIVVGVSPNDPVTFASVIGVLTAVSFLAAWLPAHRAAGLDPVRALAGE